MVKRSRSTMLAQTSSASSASMLDIQMGEWVKVQGDVHTYLAEVVALHRSGRYEVVRVDMDLEIDCNVLDQDAHPNRSDSEEHASTARATTTNTRAQYPRRCVSGRVGSPGGGNARESEPRDAADGSHTPLAPRAHHGRTPAQMGAGSANTDGYGFGYDCVPRRVDMSRIRGLTDKERRRTRMFQRRRKHAAATSIATASSSARSNNVSGRRSSRHATAAAAAAAEVDVEVEVEEEEAAPTTPHGTRPRTRTSSLSSVEESEAGGNGNHDENCASDSSSSSDESDEMEAPVCPICLIGEDEDDYMSDSCSASSSSSSCSGAVNRMTRTPCCGHSFHRGCLELHERFSANKRPACPMCRATTAFQRHIRNLRRQAYLAVAEELDF